MKPRSALLATPLLLGGFLLLSAGCARTPPRQQPVEADSPIEFNMWQSRMQGTLTREEWRWFEVVMQEFKYQAMLSGQASGGAAVDSAVRTRITGRPFSKVMSEGLRAHLQRKTAERDELETAIALNAKMKVKPEDTATLKELSLHQENLREKLVRLNDERAVIQAELARLDAAAGR